MALASTHFCDAVSGGTVPPAEFGWFASLPSLRILPPSFETGL